MINIAHRGFSAVYPENTLLSFNKALELGVDHLELDLQVTFDGHLVVMHDRTVDRTTNGSGEVSDLSLAEIRELDAGVWRGDAFAGERVPTYEDVIEKLDAPAVLVTELKFRGNDDIRKVIDTIESHGVADRVVISSFDLDKLPELRRQAPDLPTTALLQTDDTTIEQKIELTKRLGCDTIGPRCSDTTKELVDAAHEAGLIVRAWGLGRDEGPELRRMIALGVDGMTTDRPDVLQKILSESP